MHGILHGCYLRDDVNEYSRDIPADESSFFDVTKFDLTA